MPSREPRTRQSSFPPWCPRDPFNALLVAPAQIDKLVPLTAEEALTAYVNMVHLAR
jgi:hypothetical protein